MLFPLKFYRGMGRGLKMCILFEYNPQIILCYFFHKMRLVILRHKSIYTFILGILCMHLLLHFYVDPFDTLQMFRSWSEDVHIVCM